MGKRSQAAVVLLFVWLVGWIAWSWPAVQDDAFIHLRYADHLVRYHFITYDGVHRDYGASSLLYVALLALLRAVSSSPNLARATSSVVQVTLFLGLVFGLYKPLSGRAPLAKLGSGILLVLTVMPSAVRWLSDGMETGLVAGVAYLLAWSVHEESARQTSSGLRYLRLTALGYLAVLLRPELLLVCVGGFLILVLDDRREAFHASSAKGLARRSHLLLGAVLAEATIWFTMHALLPYTAAAKSHGIANWFHPLHDTVITLGGALSFGLGLLLLWIVTAVLAISRPAGLSWSSAIANSFTPMILILSACRGQEIQGVRYFVWTFFFSIVWNILQLAAPPDASVAYERSGRIVLYGLLVLLVLDVPFEARAMSRVLRGRAETVERFQAEKLDALQGTRGIASDIGYIGYFTGADLCDLAGLVNGPRPAHMSSLDREEACAKIHPDFLFANSVQFRSIARRLDLSQWKVCGSYDFTNVTRRDTHYLLVRPELAHAACSATSRTPQMIENIPAD